MADGIVLNGTSKNYSLNLGGERDNHYRLKNLGFKESGHTGFQEQLTEQQLENISKVPNKIDKEEGKGLSENDFTNEYKKALDNLPENLEDIFFEINKERLRINNHDGEISSIKNLIGDINSALDELHNYAQTIVNGGA